ncbi:MAG: hypothetical protein K9G59_17255 [Caulobacter sp.]|nr:hypothetical protein [Caulobacter sp.]
MISDLPPPAHDLRHLDPEVRKERVKLAANASNAFGLAFLIGSLVAPLVDPTRLIDLRRAVPGLLIGLAFILAATFALRYMKAKEPS